MIKIATGEAKDITPIVNDSTRCFAVSWNKR